MIANMYEDDRRRWYEQCDVVAMRSLNDREVCEKGCDAQEVRLKERSKLEAGTSFEVGRPL